MSATAPQTVTSAPHRPGKTELHDVRFGLKALEPTLGADLVIWDNRSAWHYAVDDYGDQERWGLKISIEGGDWRPR
jgi:hypothetical protein